MKRREFITLLGGAATWPLVARAQQPVRVRRIGVISYENENDADERELRDQFITRLRELGWIEGHNLHTDYRFAGDDATRMRAYARELVELQPDVIFAGYEAVRALKAATTDIPIVFAGGARSSRRRTRGKPGSARRQRYRFLEQSSIDRDEENASA